MPDVSIQKIIKIVLKNYVRDRNNINGIRERVVIPRDIHSVNLPQSALLHIYLNEGEDDEVIEWINQIPKGVRNSMLKNILRGYVNFPITIPYETDLEVTTNETCSPNQSIQQLNKSLNSPKKKKPKTQKVSTSNEKVIDEVLNASLNNETKKDIVTEQGDKVLNLSPNKEPAQQNSSSKPQNPKIDTVTPPSTSSSNESETSGDIFDDFENMMNEF
jgi:hypothetical protein